MKTGAIHPMNTINIAEKSFGRELSGDFSGCTFESSAPFAQTSHPGNATSLPSVPASAVDMRPEVFKETYPSIFKMVEVLESRATKSRDMEVRFARIIQT